MDFEVLLSVFLFLYASALTIQAQVVTISPQEDYNAPLNSALSVQFNCTSTRRNIEWRVNDTIPNPGSDLANSGVIATPSEVIAGSPGMFFSSLVIPTRNDSNNTTVQCRAIDTNAGVPVINSKVVFLNIQGLLGPPPNLSLSEADDKPSRVLSWDEPETLDITNVDPDIQSYLVCYNLTEDLTCVNASLERREFKFLNVHVPLVFTVTAVNVVGEGTTSSIVYQPSGCDNRAVASFDASKVRSFVSLNQPGTNPVVDFIFNQTRNSGITCFCVYEVQTILMKSNTSHRAQIPQLSGLSDDSVELSLTVDSDLILNEIYLAIITTVDNGKEMGFIKFSTYDVQAVSHTATSNGEELLSCVFAEGSLAQSCTLMICNETNIISSGSCVNVTINRGSLYTLAQPGLYSITAVAETEEDGEITVISTMNVLQIIITIPISVTNSPPPDSQVGVIAGVSVTVGISVAGVGAIAISVTIVVLWKKKKRQAVRGKSGGESCSMKPLTATKGKSQSQFKTGNPAYDVIRHGPSQPLDSAKAEGHVPTSIYDMLDLNVPTGMEPDPSSAPRELAYATVGPSPVSREVMPQDFNETTVQHSTVQQETQEKKSFTEGVDGTGDRSCGYDGIADQELAMDQPVNVFHSILVVYEEPYDWAVSRLPQVEPVMEQCPAYGVLTK